MKTIEGLKKEIESIEKTIGELPWGSVGHFKSLELKELVGKKEEQLKHLEHMHSLDDKTNNDTRYLLIDMMDLMDGEYAHVKAEVQDIYNATYAKLKEFEEEQSRRFT